MFCECKVSTTSHCLEQKGQFMWLDMMPDNATQRGNGRWQVLQMFHPLEELFSFHFLDTKKQAAKNIVPEPLCFTHLMTHECHRKLCNFFKRNNETLHHQEKFEHIYIYIKHWGRTEKQDVRPIIKSCFRIRPFGNRDFCRWKAVNACGETGEEHN